MADSDSAGIPLLLTCAGGAERIGARLYPSGEYEVQVTAC